MVTAASTSASSSSATLTVTVRAVLQSSAVNVRLVGDADTSVFNGTFADTVTSSVGCDLKTTV